jgi:phosphoglycolate phosphatase
LATICCQNVTFPNIAAIVFDKDGTLANSQDFLRNLAQRRSRLIDAQVPGVQEPLLMAFGIENSQINPRGLMAVGTRRENEIAAAAYVAETGRDWIEALNLVHAAFIEADQYVSKKADHTPLFAGAIELIQSLAATGLKLAILSSDTTHQVQAFVQHYQLEPYFHSCLGTDSGPAKPDPLLLETVCAALNVSPAQTLVIGDSQADIQLAHAAGAAGCIGVTWGWTEAVDLEGADAIAQDFEQIQVLVSSNAENR